MRTERLTGIDSILGSVQGLTNSQLMLQIASTCECVIESVLSSYMVHKLHHPLNSN